MFLSSSNYASSIFVYVLAEVAAPIQGKHKNINHHNFQKLPDVSSTLLKMHRRYTEQPPHDMALYHVLEVSPNATSAEISKAYRKLSRQWHPDKRKRRNAQKQRQRREHNEKEAESSDSEDEDEEEEEADFQLRRIREAYEVLKDDSTRLPYHKYGLLHTNMAAFLLTGGKYGRGSQPQLSPAQWQLLHLMGYHNITTAGVATHDRVLYLATHLVERIRPWLEGTISTSMLADSIATECDELKHLPLGAQIIRCIGRAYRHAGRKVLRRYERTHRRQRRQGWLPRKLRSHLHQPIHHHVVEEKVRDGLRHAKHLATAAMASGRVVLSERIISAMTPPSAFKTGGPTIEYDNDDNGHFLLDGPIDFSDGQSILTQEEIKDAERRKAQTAMLQALQVEALWKISKIELDRTIQEACELMLSGSYFFFPSHQVPPPPPPSVPQPLPFENDKGGRSQRHHQQRQRQRGSQSCRDYDGWVGAGGTTVDARAGKIRAAEALVLIGDIMVRCSKQGTAWME